MMKIRFQREAWWIWAVLFICLTIDVGSARASSTLPNQAHPSTWVVEGGSGARLVLLGSLHLGPPAGWEYPELIEKNFAKASSLVFEVDFSDPLNLRPGLSDQYTRLREGDSLQNHVSKGTYEKLAKHVADTSLDLKTLDSFQPWMVATLLVMEASDRGGYSAAKSVDMDFTARAQANKKQILGLETAESQMRLMAALSPEFQEAMLLDMLIDYEELDAYLARMITVWRSGDDEGLEEITFESLETMPELAGFYEIVFFKRNREMTKKLHSLLSSSDYAGQTVFVVVGAGHMLTDKGIPALLKGLGYEVRELSF